MSKLDREESKSAMQLGLFGVLIIVLVACGYYAGVRTVKEVPNRNQIVVDSITKLLDDKIKDYNILSDSLKKNTTEQFDQIDLINKIKKTIRYEINKNIIKTYFIPDSLTQRFVDSIRGAGGFN